MKKINVFLLTVIFTLFLLGNVNALTITDTTVFTETGTISPVDYVSHGGGKVNKIGDAGLATLGVDWVQWDHHFNFNPAAASINSADLTLSFLDDAGRHWDRKGRRFVKDPEDLGPEFGIGWTEGWVWDFGEIDTGDVTYEIGVEYVVDGALRVQVGGHVFTGDFYITKSVLEVDYNPVPEPTTMVLFGIGLLGLAGVGRRKKQINNF